MAARETRRGRRRKERRRRARNLLEGFLWTSMPEKSQFALFTDCQGLGCLGLSAACVKGRQMSPGRMGRRRVGAAQIQVYSWTTGSLGAAGHCKFISSIVCEVIVGTF